MKACKTLFAVLLAVSGAAGFLHAQDLSAADIVEKSRNRIDAKTTSVRSRMVVTGKDGGVSRMSMDQYEKKDAQGHSRSVVDFKSTKEIKNSKSVDGARFLTVETGDGNNDQRIYLPNVGKVRRIDASQGSGSFMGTDLSYDDVSSAERDTALDTHTLVREETYQGKDCYVIESVPKNPKYQYSKMVQWIDKETFIPWKLELYNSKGKQVKLLEVLGAEDKQGRLTVTKTKMSTLADNTSTLIQLDIVRYDDEIPELVFTEEYLRTGKVPRQ